MMMRELVEYQADLNFPPLAESKIERLQSIAENYRFNPTIKSRSFRFKYNGRDAERHVLTFLREIASVIGNAKGQIECETIWETDDETHESYQISDGVLKKAEQDEFASV